MTKDWKLFVACENYDVGDNLGQDMSYKPPIRRYHVSQIFLCHMMLLFHNEYTVNTDP